jgi:spore coat polysaccharide biosynthesis protein SpsF
MTERPRTVAIIQARTASSRLPGKVLLDIGGEPMLVRVVERTRRAKWIDEVGIATTTEAGDDMVAELCRSRGYPVYRGDQFDVLDRYYRAAQQFQAQVIVRLTADCPVIDPDVVDDTIQAFFDSGAEFAANRLPPPRKRTYPIGLDTEVVSFTALERAWKEAAEPYEREHVMPYFYDQEGRFKIRLVEHEPDYGALRWTVDTMEDLALLREIYSRFGNRDDFGWKDILALLESEPQLSQINAQVKAKLGSDVDQRMQPKCP